MTDWTIRNERPADVAAISTLTTAAFEGHPYSDGTEAAIVDGLRAAGDLSLSLVAEGLDGAVIGHVAFSPVTLEGIKGWYGLGPVSVSPAEQRRGIGSALIRAGLARLRSTGAAGCVLVGNAAYYTRFGFANDPAAVFEGAPAEHFLVLAFGDETARGVVRFHPAFGV